ncbi:MULTISPECIES: MBL fold metallo-hydrolase [unclassified Bradyrhizobium]|uniref:MBL fold metallo-hydrolase n=1 Tax=unclassified Bradyrhizobium TaxID=2631580 RepID=UPI002478CA27|nr:MULTISPECIES: MBL fold metallo-hydrolase [unclassified Bradyrhizobium]WGR68967.1 MBL fold metallo-hydrolase [Bradyrhizobium sp. ISRA426]WGR81022.1 MBL fold metallo-hydrolase [Bradyrhizobium sp. ISRA430]WGR84206.1 MBL fold metallo-hydrolase [Bradyrhizobium sp. ISRA432]
MKVHHLNTGTMCPMGQRLVNGTGSLFQRARMVCHCLLIETDIGLVLVDTGIGLGDIAAPGRLGRRWLRQTAPKLDPSETAVEQVRALGYSPNDVRHVLLTHLDRDHAGGVPDFPHAAIHVHRAEYDMAVLRKPPPPEGRYVTEQWQHRPSWKFYDEAGEDWFGFKGVRALGDREADVLIIPLAGHTLGHCGIAVRISDKWLLHAGDSYFFHGQLEASARMPLVLGYFQRRVDMDRNARIANQARLRALKLKHGDRVTVFNSHDPVDYENCRCGAH